VSEKLCALRLIRAAEVGEAAVEETLAQNDPRGPLQNRRHAWSGSTR